MPESVLIPASNELKLALTALIWLAVSNDPDTTYIISSFFYSKAAIESHLDSIELEFPAHFHDMIKSTMEWCYI